MGIWRSERGWVGLRWRVIRAEVLPETVAGALLAGYDRAVARSISRSHRQPYAPATEAGHIRGRSERQLHQLCSKPLERDWGSPADPVLEFSKRGVQPATRCVYCRDDVACALREAVSSLFWR